MLHGPIADRHVKISTDNRTGGGKKKACARQKILSKSQGRKSAAQRKNAGAILVTGEILRCAAASGKKKTRDSRCSGGDEQGRIIL